MVVFFNVITKYHYRDFSSVSSSLGVARSTLHEVNNYLPAQGILRKQKSCAGNEVEGIIPSRGAWGREAPTLRTQSAILPL